MKLPVDYTSLTPEKRREVRNQYVANQNNLCYFCKQSLSSRPKGLPYKIKRNLFPEKFFVYPVHLHHNHDTGMTIGATHAFCNAVLFQYFNE